MKKQIPLLSALALSVALGTVSGRRIDTRADSRSGGAPQSRANAGKSAAGRD